MLRQGGLRAGFESWIRERGRGRERGRYERHTIEKERLAGALRAVA